ncbi:MAG: hypothetical protein M3Y74_08665 [Chloroflexota bacterium]|nr:hypothetical protein [Chloroflexota bacterium]
MKEQRGEPARLPLEGVRGRRTPDNVLVDELVVVKPGDEGYEQDYAFAARCHEMYGDPMPYADVEKPSVSPPQPASSDGHVTPC